jgi:hypothetical protein
MSRWPKVLGMTYGEWMWLLCGLALLAYEVWAALTKGGDVLTRAMRAGLPRWTSVNFGIGLLMGHLMGPVWPAFRFAWVIPFVILAGCLARDLLVGGRVTSDATTPLFLVGFIAGIFWVGRP